jgi:hypothetical protein
LKHVLSIYIGNKEKRKEHQPKLHIEGEGIPKARSTQCNKMLQYSGMDWNYLAQDRDKWRTLTNTVMNLQVA